jgi:hypothetical protein
MKTKGKDNNRRRQRSTAKDLGTRQAAGVKGGLLLPAVNQFTGVPAVQLADGSVRKAAIAEKW